ncbi:MAG: hypothetical protein OJF49_000631 [Ktedonobacterales bacterium]|jgi:ABC-type transport system involved in multi-copper enzyme maturation permease subunit|nr:MAG: hypothetical protein OJF49_000631 [Ktedonobacterales bacterium]
MIWLVWRRHRLGILALTLLALALAVYLVIGSWPARAAYYQVTNGQSPASCYASQSTSTLCTQLTAQWRDTYDDPGDVLGWLGILIAPAVLGMFLGAPLVADELESGTQRLAWTQGVTRRRWLLTLIASEAIVALLLAGVVQVAVWYWLGSYPPDGNGFGAFDMMGMAPLAYVAFALMLGLAMGALVRRVVPAMLLTLVGYLAVRIPIVLYARPHYLPPLTLTWDPYVTPNPRIQPGSQDWVVSGGWLDSTGKPIGRGDFFARVFGAGGPRPGPNYCTPMGQPDANIGTDFNGWNTLCTHNYGWHYQTVWQPADRFWLFQGIECALFLALAVALVALTLWLVRRVLA